MMSQNILYRLALIVALVIPGAVMADGDLSSSREVTVNAAPATVWKMIGDFNHLDVWHPVVIASELNGDIDKPGSQRILTLGNGANLKEKLLAHDNSEMSYTYAILESPLPVKNYVSTVSVMPADEGKSLVKWSSSFDANGAEDAKAVETITGIYDAGLNNLAKHFNN